VLKAAYQDIHKETPALLTWNNAQTLQVQTVAVSIDIPHHWADWQC